MWKKVSEPKFNNGVVEGNNIQWGLNTICEQIMHTKNDLKGQAWL